MGLGSHGPVDINQDDHIENCACQTAKIYISGDKTDVLSSIHLDALDEKKCWGGVAQECLVAEGLEVILLTVCKLTGHLGIVQKN